MSDTMFETVQDSGAREDFGTGAVRDKQHGKGLPHLIPPIALRRLAQHFENGAEKYGRNNWQNGIPLSSYIDSAQRHLWAIIEGKDDEDHAAAVIWNISCFIWTKSRISEGVLPERLDDL